jgi:hypothetical protein
LHYELLRRHQTESKYLSSLQTKERHGFHDVPDVLNDLENKHSHPDAHAPVHGEKFDASGSLL